MISKTIHLLFILPCIFFPAACHKSDVNQPPVNQLSYGDSVFYVKNQATDYIVLPTETRTGKYYGFPEGIELDENTGAVTINKSETGLRYKISFVPNGSTDTISAMIIISGINYYDKIYNLSNNDTLALPVYNANAQSSIPGTNSNSIFDEGGGCNGEGIAVNINDARINLAQTIRNGTFGPTPANGSQKEVELRYRISDPSQKALNSLKVKIYYFNTAADMTPDLIQLLKDRQGTILRAAPRTFIVPEILATESVTQVTKAAKPRPPCIFIVGR